MIVVYFFFLVLLFIVIVMLVPLKVKIKYSEVEDKSLKTDNKIEIYILKIIKIKTINLKSKEKINNKKKYKIDAIYKLLKNYLTFEKQEKKIVSKKELQKIFNSIYYEKFDIDIGINLENSIINAYLITIINIVINMFILKNEKNISLDNTRYYTYISNNIFNLRMNLIINCNLIVINFIIIKIIYRVIKLNTKKNSKIPKRKMQIAKS